MAFFRFPAGAVFLIDVVTCSYLRTIQSECVPHEKSFLLEFAIVFVLQRTRRMNDRQPAEVATPDA
jgi:hypothetical protein